ncbi:MAG: DUF2480 family protein [Candidatus Marinimicrobia bacterium]|jgi:hypothetical protein|nr:DUF2480 family protein [Candidatus Neomarinimicrobiota bacterium]MBT3618041.1 DUF2480 family protein [Candidatus Neomarinimicrobiota bacterium]MBT3828502.1 DUF2480 family protein [Candidatus Neomarinimicrobiota bacterium]MBT3998027.1 DUF2480 family protein [Candidatus Neomarinimicrobiota bacterium]MBT4280269.1 DUF2480 family protein [Candidatus Neomarinimicrobiota bacterium]
MDNFLDGGILKEKSFRKQADETDWSQYEGERVLIKGCAEVAIPTWAYCILAAKLSQVADHVLYGEACAAVKIFDRKEL